MRRHHYLVAAATATLLLAACSNANSGDDPEPAASGASAAAGAWKAPTQDCDDPAAATKEISGTLKVGWSAALSGPLAGAVGAVLQGMKDRFAVENAAGGINGVKLDVVTRDDAFDPAKAKANVGQLIQSDKVDVLDVFGSGQLDAVADDQNAACVPLLFAQSGVPTFRDVKSFPWTTQYLPSADVETAFDVELLKKKYPNGAKVAIAANQTESGKGLADGFKKALQGTNLELVKEVSLADPAAAATTLSASGAQVLFDAGVTTDCPALSTAIGRSGWKPETFIQPSNCVDGNTLYKPAGAAADGQLVPVWLKNPASDLYASDPGMTDYLAKLKAQNNAAPTNSYTVNGWVIGDLMIDVFKKAASSPSKLSHAGIMEAARTQEYQPPMFIDGIKWKMAPTAPLGILAFRPFQWDATAVAFKPFGDVIDISGKYITK
ncbi:ABC transporter substrate-binding protein [Dactylosporangium sp. NPDC049140]|uniref:ABC transporter substrate-binding protein n=1 Tax=Dactylosporangium sp. NPDC049140 TaxID=3155647 RepID=UPI0033D28769